MKNSDTQYSLLEYLNDGLEAYTGEIKNIIFCNEETNFIIASFDTVDGNIIIKGNIINPTPGLPIEVKGEWEENPNYGRQLKVSTYKIIEPISKDGIVRYLSSGLIPDIGPVFAQKIVDRFGPDAFNILKNNPEKVLEIPGIGKKKLNSIVTFFNEHYVINDIIYFLISKKVTPTYAYKIYDAFKEDSISVIKENPYKLIEVVSGIGFKKADNIARELGIDEKSDFRLKSAAIFILDTAANQKGHTFLPQEEFIAELSALLSISSDDITEKIDSIIDEDKIIQEEDRFYLVWNYRYEQFISYKLQLLRKEPVKIIYNVDLSLKDVESIISISLSDEQADAVREAVNEKVFILTGGPGTGKTTIIKFITNVFLKNRLSVLLCCPTGRAAKRLSEATHLNAYTIHKLLEYSIQNGFKKNENNPLECDVLIIDEMSMVDLKVFYNLLKALPSSTRILMVGDVNQLASVGAGNLLKDLIASNIPKVFVLNKIFRQSEDSLIILNSHKIKDGCMPICKNQIKHGDFYFIEKEDRIDILNTVITLFLKRIPNHFNIDRNDIQILSPIYKSVIGVDNINNIIQTNYNLTGKKMVWGNRTFKINDRVMQLVNNYNKNVMNGDIGKVLSFGNDFDELVENSIDKKRVKNWYRGLEFDKKEKLKLSLLIDFDGNTVMYDPQELDEITLAYAVTIHKSQGSEFKAVVIPLHTTYYIMLARNLIYTAVTRGKELVIIVGTKKAMRIAIDNDKEQLRYSSLLTRLNEDY